MAVVEGAGHQILTTALFLPYRRLTVWVLMGVAAAGSISFTLVGKALVGRSRPPLEDAVPPYEQSFSFPSGHTLKVVLRRSGPPGPAAELSARHRAGNSSDGAVVGPLLA